MDPGLVSLIAGGSAALGSLLGYMGNSRRHDSDDKTNLHRQVAQLYQLNETLRLENKENSKLIDELQDKLRRLQTALDKRDAEIQKWQDRCSNCSNFKGN